MRISLFKKLQIVDQFIKNPVQIFRLRTYSSKSENEVFKNTNLSSEFIFIILNNNKLCKKKTNQSTKSSSNNNKNNDCNKNKSYDDDNDLDKKAYV